MYAFPSPSPREVLKEGRPIGWAGCSERSAFSLMCYLGGASNCCPCSARRCNLRSRSPFPLRLITPPASAPEPCWTSEGKRGGKRGDLGRLCLVGGSELRCTSHRQRPGLLLTCCWRRINNGGHHPPRLCPWAQAASAFN